MKMTRRQFLGTTVIGAAVAACGGDDGGTQVDAAFAGRNCATNGTTVMIGTNHGHTLTVSASDVTTGTEKTYDITGTGGHAHSVTVTAANFATLQSNSNGTLNLVSTSGAGHTHMVTINCA